MQQLKPGSKARLNAMTNPAGIKKEALQKVQALRLKKNRARQEQAQMIEALKVAGKPASAKEILGLGKLPQVPLIALTEGKAKGFYYWHASIVTGQGPDVVLLHGWGCNHQHMQPLAKHLQDRFRVTNLDLPGREGCEWQGAKNLDELADQVNFLMKKKGMPSIN